MEIRWIILICVLLHNVKLLSGINNHNKDFRGQRRYIHKDDSRVSLDTSLFLRESHYGLPIQTVTVNVGQTARLTCFVQTPGEHKVAWMNKVTNAVLSMGENVIAKDSRLSVQREQRTTWILTITNVTIKDHGYYTCNINTQPPTSIHGFLNVVEPPVLDETYQEMWVMEGMAARLSCMAHGTPTPTYKWIREDYNSIRINSSLYLLNWEGQNLTLQHTNHESAGVYICIASNGYPPSKSKRFMLYVYFPPIVRGPGIQFWASQGDSVSLTCLYAGYPVPDVLWILENHLGARRMTEEHFTNTLQDGHPPYTHNMTLQIRKLTSEDFGRYTCIITNREGEGSYTTTLREVTTTIAPPPTRQTTRASSSTPMTQLYSSIGSPTSSRSYTNYDDETVNLSAPLIINFKTDVHRDKTSRSQCLEAYPYILILIFFFDSRY